MIRKEDVIKMLDEWLERLDESDVSEAIECVLLMVKNKIENMPEAVARGEWLEVGRIGAIIYSKNYARCSACNEIVWDGWSVNFCPNCGADMRGEK